MKILLYSYVFQPSIGGIEIVSATLAECLTQLGHSVTLVTETSSPDPDSAAYSIVRKPSAKQRVALVRSHDVVHSNGASMALFFYAKLLRKPFLWTHGGYQLSCIDGLGWVDGTAAPLTPWASVKFHWKRSGLKFALVEAVKLSIRRLAGSLVDANIAITEWVAMRQPLPNQVVIYNPFPLAAFSKINRNTPKQFDFIYVGRLVSEKGVPELITAFSELQKLLPGPSSTLAIVGEGNWRQKVELLTRQNGLENQITFFGKKSGKDLHDIVAEASIAIVPSVWEEPMGGVALELMAAGKNIIVSRHGGLYECVGEGASVFDNGNSEQLKICMLQLLQDEELRKKQLKLLANQLQKFDPLELTKKYADLYQNILDK